MLALIDQDLLCYRCAASAEQDEFAIAVYRIDELLDNLLTKTNATSYRAFLTGPNNFRKKIYPEYKANRTQPKPRHLKDLQDRNRDIAFIYHNNAWYPPQVAEYPYNCLICFRHALHDFRIDKHNGGSTVINSRTYNNKPNNKGGTKSQLTRHNNTVDRIGQCSTLQDMQEHSTTKPN